MFWHFCRIYLLVKNFRKYFPEIPFSNPCIVNPSNTEFSLIVSLGLSGGPLYCVLNCFELARPLLDCSVNCTNVHCIYQFLYEVQIRNFFKQESFCVQNRNFFWSNFFFIRLQPFLYTMLMTYRQKQENVLICC